jgi:DNA (cytosine-5)-methyltransferase 1
VANNNGESTMETENTFIEMFSGIAGFRLGLERAGWKCLWANDWDEYACKIYRKHFGYYELKEGDINDIRVEDIPDHKLLVGGFPCQAFSVAGERLGTKEYRGLLFNQIARVAEAKRPQILLLENVRGLLSSRDGEDFAIILQRLGKLGYILQWSCLNSRNFGVPQNRERVFIIGYLGKERFRGIFPIT